MVKSRSDTKSHRVGRVTLHDGVITTAYRAVVELTCVQCAGVITPGALFSRRSRHVPVGAVDMATSDPVCGSCRPLSLDDAGGAAGATDAREGGYGHDTPG